MNGVAGGNATFGTVVAEGHLATYPAPAIPPESKPVWIAAGISLPGRPEARLGAPITVAP